MTTSTNRPARKSTRNPGPLPAVTGSVRVLRPIGAIGEPDAQTGEIEINGKPYYLTCGPTCYRLHGWDGRRKEVTVYDVAPDCQSCDCPDFVSRSHRREDHTCKHCKAIAALIARGKLPAIKAPTAAVEVAEFDEDADLAAWEAFNASADALAEAWHSQFDE